MDIKYNRNIILSLIMKSSVENRSTKLCTRSPSGLDKIIIQETAEEEKRREAKTILSSDKKRTDCQKIDRKDKRWSGSPKVIQDKNFFLFKQNYT